MCDLPSLALAYKKVVWQAQWRSRFRVRVSESRLRLGPRTIIVNSVRTPFPSFRSVAVHTIFTSFLAGALAVGQPALPTAPEPGATVADFSLKDIRRRPRALEGFKDKRAFVVVFLDTECPLANLYLPTLIDMHKEYAAKDVQFIGINSNRQDTFIAVAAHAQEREIPFPVLRDIEH